MDTSHRTNPQSGQTPPRLDGELRFDEESRQAAAADFGHIVHRVPRAVLVPGSDEDIAQTVAWAAAQGRTFTPRGAQHSVYGRSQVQDGIVADMTARASVSVRDDRVVVDAGAKWSDVLAATLPEGKAPPVLPDYLDLSVGGTIVVGGVGATTSRFGVVADIVLELDVVTGAGRRVTCSPDHERDLFDAVRAGLGQVGVVTRVTLALTAAPESVRRYLLVYPDLAGMLADARLLSGSAGDRFDVVQGAILPSPEGGWVYRLDLAAYFAGAEPNDESLLAGLSDEQPKRQVSTLGYFDYLNKLAMLEGALRGNGQWFHPHPWLTTFIGDSQVEPVVAGELARVNPPADLGQFGQVVLSPIRRDAVSSPLLRLPADDLCYAFNFVRVPTTDDAAEAARLVETNKAVYERVRDAGGVLYPVSALPMDAADWRRHFGPAFDRLADAKREHDPHGVLTPGYELF